MDDTPYPGWNGVDAAGWYGIRLNTRGDEPRNAKDESMARDASHRAIARVWTGPIWTADATVRPG